MTSSTLSIAIPFLGNTNYIRTQKNYFSQEYLSTGSQPDKFGKMILIEALITNSSVEDIIRLKLAELEKRKKNDPVVNYKVFNNPDKSDYLLDFLVSEGRDRLTMAEWNVYRYESFKDSVGHQGVMILIEFFSLLGDHSSMPIPLCIQHYFWATLQC